MIKRFESFNVKGEQFIEIDDTTYDNLIVRFRDMHDDYYKIKNFISEFGIKMSKVKLMLMLKLNCLF